MKGTEKKLVILSSPNIELHPIPRNFKIWLNDKNCIYESQKYICIILERSSDRVFSFSKSIKGVSYCVIHPDRPYVCAWSNSSDLSACATNKCRMYLPNLEWFEKTFPREPNTHRRRFKVEVTVEYFLK